MACRVRMQRLSKAMRARPERFPLGDLAVTVSTADRVGTQ